MLTTTTDALDKLQPQPAGSVTLDTGVKTRPRDSKQAPANPAAQSALSAAALEHFVRDHRADLKNLPLSQLAGTSVETFAREKVEEQKKEEEKSPYSIGAAATQQQVADDQAEKDEQQREYEQRLLTGEELARFDEMVEQVDQNLSQNDDKMKQIDAMLDKKKQDLESREIVIGEAPNQRHVLVGPNGTFVDAGTNKPLTDPKDIADAKAKEKPNSATVEENQTLEQHKKSRDQLAANENSLKQQQQQIKNSPKNNKADDDEKKLQPEVQDEKKKEDDLTSKLQQNAANVKADRQAQINANHQPPTPGSQPKSPAQENKVAETEKKKVQEYDSTNQKTLNTEANRLNKLAPVETNAPSNSMHARFAALQAKGANTQTNANTPASPNRTPSFASTQSGLNDGDDKMKKLGNQMQSAFTAGAQGANPSANLAANNPSPVNNSPALKQIADKKVAAPAIA